MKTNFICTTCGVQQAATQAEPSNCIICEDDRQYVHWNGQQWTTQEALQQEYKNIIYAVEPQLYRLQTEPKFAIGQKAYLLQSPGGNILWDCITLLDEETKRQISALGGIKAIIISHPHYYASMVDYSLAFGNIPIYIHAADQQWVVRPDAAIKFWKGTYLELWDGIKVINCGGHFPGACVLHWPHGAANKGILLSGDAVQVVMDRKSVSFMYSYPNLIPLPKSDILNIQDSLAGFNFEKIYGAFEPHIAQEARAVFNRSISRYLQIFK
ncbi:MBL fold metallo-hydrolase [Adhaeribacter rhizoryzae]|uniref:MBL fold metallo-hydrolase n=1 Tax=Adhaeribacter rhizoryzae TaxID=2607907 RepID=A0A5M6DJM0_9BACT|nr:MBL fold metallo-hydrolase [Adhaeribacter rhizoryzae]KAA5547757.1 MBL fold metallo-hydrolase [Adhaeribacter rhizoryzae]